MACYCNSSERQSVAQVQKLPPGNPAEPFEDMSHPRPSCLRSLQWASEVAGLAPTRLLPSDLTITANVNLWVYPKMGRTPPKGSFNRENDDLAMKLGVPNSQTNPYVDVPANTCICNACSLQSHFFTMHRSSNF